MAVGLQQVANSKASAIHFGKKYLLINGFAQANNGATSQTSDTSANATYFGTITVDNDSSLVWTLSGDVYAGGDVTGPGLLLPDDNTAIHVRPTQAQLTSGILQSGWDLVGSSPNISITPTIYSRTGGASSVWIPVSMLKKDSKVFVNITSSATYNESGTAPNILTHFGTAFVGVGTSQVKGASPGAEIGSWQFLSDPDAAEHNAAVGCGTQSTHSDANDNGIVVFDMKTGKVTRL